jgi:hypothetical protein
MLLPSKGSFGECDEKEKASKASMKETFNHNHNKEQGTNIAGLLSSVF